MSSTSDDPYAGQPSEEYEYEQPQQEAGLYAFGGQQEPMNPPSMLPPALFSDNPFAVPMPPLPPDQPSRSYHSVPPTRGLGGRGGRGGRGRGAPRGGTLLGLYSTELIWTIFYTYEYTLILVHPQYSYISYFSYIVECL